MDLNECSKPYGVCGVWSHEDTNSQMLYFYLKVGSLSVCVTRYGNRVLLVSTCVVFHMNVNHIASLQL